MANTIKINGAGALTGRTWYATIVKVKGDWVALHLDSPSPQGFIIEEFCPRSGALLVPDTNGTTTDLMHVDRRDMPHFLEATSADAGQQAFNRFQVPNR